MKILFLTPVFAPSLGGVERVSAQVADGMARRGHQVRLATETTACDQVAREFEVIRRPSGRELRKLFRWADVVWHHQLCLRMLVRSACFPRPMGATFHTWLPEGALVAALRRKVVRCFDVRYGVSEAIAEHLPNPSGTLPNSYDPSVFKPEEVEKRWDFGCVARMVSDKGVDLLIQALATLREKGIEASCAVVGDGPEKPALEQRVRLQGLNTQVSFLPSMCPLDLAAFFRGCGALVIPSRWREPFGLVAVESIACGTPVIVAKHGGLPEATGDCGLYFQPGCSEDLAVAMEQMFLSGEASRQELMNGREAHLALFHPEVQLDAYEGAMIRLIGGTRGCRE